MLLLRRTAGRVGHNPVFSRCPKVFPPKSWERKNKVVPCFFSSVVLKAHFERLLAKLVCLTGRSAALGALLSLGYMAIKRYEGDAC